MAPEVSVRQSYEDCVAAYEALLADGYAPDRILVMGDSAGGGLAADSACGSPSADSRSLPRSCCSHPGSIWPTRANR